jgi:hypothetical protein
MIKWWLKATYIHLKCITGVFRTNSIISHFSKVHKFLNFGCEITEFFYSLFSQMCSLISWIMFPWFIRFVSSRISPATVTRTGRQLFDQNFFGKENFFLFNQRKVRVRFLNFQEWTNFLKIQINYAFL